jgi:para-nitrobenzyl esterase
MRRFFFISAVLAVATGIGAIPAAADVPGLERPAESSESSVLARTESGWVRGEAGGDHVTFSGVPYAAPPTGALRWASPEPPSRWHGIRDATRAADVCPQVETDDNGDPTVVGNEDCLYLNVTAPRDRPARERLPVLVWIHGGNFTSGAGSQYDGARLAAEGGLLVVTINYRLDALGFLSSPSLDTRGATSGNYGIEDQTAALRWVRRNAASFGGDPSNVTLAGQSAGARSVCVHLASPMSRGLFDRAIIQSAACANQLVTKPVADERGTRAIAEVGCTAAPDVAACLRQRPVDALLATLPGVGEPINDRVSDDPWGPVTGTPLLPTQPIDAITSGSAAHVPILLGSTRDETRPFVGFRHDAGGNPLSEDGYRAIIAETFGEDADAVLERYPAAEHASPALALSAVLTDWGGSIGACPVLRTAEAGARHGRVYLYEFQEPNPAVIQGFPLGAHHSWDLHFIWDARIPGGERPELTAPQQALGRQLRGYWSSFARTGDPNGGSRPPWHPFNRTGPVLGLDAANVAPTPFAETHHCAFWADR